ncbi:hypothetical protein HK102_009303, partial [Quaeritorhiza haematococci]
MDPEKGTPTPLAPNSTHASQTLTAAHTLPRKSSLKNIDNSKSQSKSKLNTRTPKPAKPKSKWRVTLENWMVNEGPVWILAAVWFSVQIALFLYNFTYYNTTPIYTRVRSIVGLGLPIARSAASIINLASGLILFTVCRNIISMVRKVKVIHKVLPLDHNIVIHRALGWTIAFWSFVHSVAHFFNLLNRWRASGGLETPETNAWATGTGITGQLLVLVLFLMVTSSVFLVRRKYFEIFWFTHHLFLLWFALLLLHGSFCFIKADGPNPCGSGPSFWKYWVASGFCYLTERIIREIRGRFLHTHIHKVIQHPSKVVEVQIKKPSVRMQSGQYIFLCCPEVALYEWHPFTLTSAPQEDFISVHIRVVGDWTTAFAERLGCRWDKKGMPCGMDPAVGAAAREALPRVMVDGPYGAASEDVFKYEVSVCVGAGIGVTPFASVLKNIWYHVINPTTVIKLRKVYFIWVCRDKEAFEWFQDLLHAIEEESLDAFLDLRIYLTGAFADSEIRNLVLNDQEGVSDALTGLRSPTFYGRPNLDALFKDVFCRGHPGADIGVFFCGPKP